MICYFRQTNVFPWLLATCFVAFTLLHVSPSLGQDQAGDATATLAEPAANDELEEEDDRRGPLPPYYSELVTPGQRERIYTIQESYEDEIEALQEQVRRLVAKRDAEIEAVLTTSQKQLLVQLRQQAELLRKARAQAAKELNEELEEEPAAGDEPVVSGSE